MIRVAAWVLSLVVVSAFIGGCAGAPKPPTSGSATLWGFVQLVPHEGVAPRSEGGAAYADPALRDVRFVDYSRPGFAVVYAESEASPSSAATPATFTIRSSSVRTRLEPSHAATSTRGAIRVVNQSEQPHVVSDPVANVVRRLAPDEELEISSPEAGPHSIYLVTAAGVSVQAFVAPGQHSVVSGRGRFELADLEPGLTTIRVWHPHFPPIERSVRLLADSVVRLDMQMGPDRDDLNGGNTP